MLRPWWKYMECEPQTIDVKMALFLCPQVAWQLRTPISFQELEVEQGLIHE